jgi:hypothetical protein
MVSRNFSLGGERETTPEFIARSPYPLALEPEDLAPQEFCRRVLGIANLPPNYIKLYENQIGYRRQCLQLLSAILDVDYATVKNWRTDFQKMPHTYRRILGITYERLAALRELEELRQRRGSDRPSLPQRPLSRHRA